MTRSSSLLVCLLVAVALLVGISVTTGQQSTDRPASIRGAVRKLERDVAALKKEVTAIKAQLAELQAKERASAPTSISQAKQRIVGRWRLSTPEKPIWVFGGDGAYTVLPGNAKGTYDIKEDTLKPGEFVLVVKLAEQGVGVEYAIRSFTKDVIVLSGPGKGALAMSRIRD